MCRVEERIYITAEGHRSKFEEAFPCEKARKNRLCANVRTRTTEYYPKRGTNLRDSTPSPIGPPTPTGSGSYIVQPRRPSSSGGERPSTRDGPKIKPEIIINFSGQNKKGKRYVHVSTGSYKRSSDEIAIESPDSDASHTIRTGYPEASLPPQATIYGHPDVYGTAPTHGYHHRHTSSTASYTGSSQTPSLLVTSDVDYDSPTTTRAARLQPAIHYSSATSAPLSPSRSRNHERASSNDYNLSVVTPRDDYYDLADRSASSHASSGASGSSRRRKDHDAARKRKEEEEENVKQVRFDLGRTEARANERAESQLAEKEKDRAVAREEARRHKKKDHEAETTKARKKEEAKPAPSTSSMKAHTGSRKGSVSMTPSQQKEQRRLLAAELDHMQVESRAAEEREREERATSLRQQQQDPSYYNPRAGPMPNSASTMTRHNPTSRRDSFTSETRPVMGRSNSRRTSISQSKPPMINTQVAPSYTQPPSTRVHAPPPVSFPANFNTRPTSARRSSLSSQENPFLAQTRPPGASLENPFATTPSVMSPTIHQDPWDARNVREALPTLRQSADTRYSSSSGGHTAAREASRAMARATSARDDYAAESDDDMTHGHTRRRR
ncbi:hypothetical protein HBI83_049120 [Parastagonospora nodorum]|nr:hypothetical protein HBI83_049120 [Parastagonospora nodorum]